MANPIILPLPDGPGPGAWVDATALGPGPLAQMSAAATAGDTCHLETAAISSATVGALLAPLKGENGPTTLDRAVAFLRAVRDDGPTHGLSVTVTGSTTAGIQGPPGPQGPVGPASGGAALIWKPGAPPGSPANVFSDWNALVAASLPHSTVIADNTLVPGGIQFPAGVWPNFDAILGQLTVETTLASTLDGAVFPNVRRIADNILIRTHANSVSPFPITDGDLMILEDGGIIFAATGSTQPSMLATPGSGGTGPTIRIGTTGILGNGGAGAPPTLGISPQTPGANDVTVVLDGGSLVSNTVGGLGPNATSSVLVVLVLSEASFELSAPITQLPSLATLAFDDLTGTQTGQFAADTGRVDGLGGTPQIIPAFGGTTTLLPNESNTRFRAVLMNAAGVKTHIDMELTGSGAGDGNTGTVQLLKNGVPVPGASFSIPISLGTTVTGSASGFLSQHEPGDFYNLTLAAVAPIPGPGVFHGISSSLR
jgi:hypothetical protein